MKRMRKSFEKWYKRYATKKVFFKERIEHFASTGKVKQHKQGHQLLEEAERILIELRKTFDSKKATGDVYEITRKVRRFKSIYKELDECTKMGWVHWTEAMVLAIIIVVVLRNFVFGLYRIPSGSAEPTLLVGDRAIGNKIAYKWGKKPKRNDLVMFDDPTFEYDQYNKLNAFWQRYVGYGIPMFGLGDGPNNMVKRIIGMPGDTIQGRVENGRTVIYLNGKLLDEPYVNPYPLIAMEKRTGFIDLDHIGPIPIPETIKKQTRYPVFYTYVPGVEYALQPYYNMSSEDVFLKPGTLTPWQIMPGLPSKNEYGRIVDTFGPINLPEGKYWVMGDSRSRSKDSRFWGLLDEKLLTGRVSLVVYSIDSEEPLWLFELIKSPVKFWTKSIRWKRFGKWVNQWTAEAKEIQDKK